MRKYIFVTGGVCSSLGKGVAASSLGSLLESRGLSVCMVKIDPYLNVDAGTMSPFQHGEVFVTDDGAETDLDLGNYARFTKSPLYAANSITTGQIYQEVIRKERKGDYLGKCVQVVPHITDEIKRRIYLLGEKKNTDVTIVEIGGTVGDIESIPFLEAVRQIIQESSRRNALSVHVSLIPTVSGGELKTKPTQHSVKALREIGIQPDILLCRIATEMSDDMKHKIASFTNVDYECVFSAHDVSTIIYDIPIIYRAQGLDKIVCERLSLDCSKDTFGNWQRVSDTWKNAKETVEIAMVGKYIDLEDSYKSIDESLIHGAIFNAVRIKIRKIDSENLTSPEETEKALAGVNGLIIPGGFGQRGISGMIDSARLAREQRIPFLGICLGMQIQVIEWARNVAGLKDADSGEFEPNSPHNVIVLLEDQVDITQYGGTMRLGRGESVTVEGSRIYAAYGKKSIFERHRHRYEVNNRYRTVLEKSGLIFSAFTPDGQLIESAEWPNHPWAVGIQFHPEFSSTPLQTGYLFRDFIAAAVDMMRT
ncbi:CTP synthase [Olavius algarvensis spirochete endosymbiont]|uniref:CTP synthase n=1 Tax=Olavius algarvensis spirochete endosymbiont TaxID=260710 RepID=UPI00052CB394|nr:CTP synthase [Olavius algarvensis spirochete endosymbiont]KGM43225.1 CTP synthetase [Alkalispirochaeta odontotermitis]CAD7839216.1 MAG: CTP synthase (EC 6.3.4.2) [Olavius algarvensis spirochete endosymbiont]VDA99193.1 CTP synthase [Olavius algarvensis spirochete endosymbiont]